MHKPTIQQIERYIKFARDQLGPDWCDPYVAAIEQHLRDWVGSPHQTRFCGGGGGEAKMSASGTHPIVSGSGGGGKVLGEGENVGLWRYEGGGGSAGVKTPVSPEKS